MFDIGFSEILIILALGLVILGPDRLPGAIKTVIYWSRKARAGIDNAKTQISQELNADEIQKNLGEYNRQLQSLKHTVKSGVDVDKINEDIGKAFSMKEERADKDKPSKEKVASKSTKTAVRKASNKTKSKVTSAGKKKSTTKVTTATKISKQAVVSASTKSKASAKSQKLPSPNQSKAKISTSTSSAKPRSRSKITEKTTVSS